MNLLELIAQAVTKFSGSTSFTLLSFAIIILWTIGGAVYFGFGDSYQLIINSLTTIITFLMTSLIQRSQSKEFSAMHMKLNELIINQTGASSSLINLEDRSEKEIDDLHEKYNKLLELSREARNIINQI